MSDYAAWAELRPMSREHLMPWEPQLGARRADPYRLSSSHPPLSPRGARGSRLRIPHVRRCAMIVWSAASRFGTSAAASRSRPRSATGSARPYVGQGHMSDAVRPVAATPSTNCGCTGWKRRACRTTRLDPRAGRAGFRARRRRAALPPDRRCMGRPSPLRALVEDCLSAGSAGGSAHDAHGPPADSAPPACSRCPAAGVVRRRRAAAVGLGRCPPTP